ncbi:MAG: hypothetical protein ACLUE1_00995 [Adlercreutzia equolifaciens]
MRFYGFNVSEIIDEDNPFLAPDVDPKANWALNHLDFFPVEVNSAPLEALLRVPGIGVRGAKLICRARRQSTLGEAELRKLGIAYKRARYFITMNGAWGGSGVDFSREALHARLSAPIDAVFMGVALSRPSWPDEPLRNRGAPPVLPEGERCGNTREVAFAAQASRGGRDDRAAAAQPSRHRSPKPSPTAANARQPAALGGLVGAWHIERIRGGRPLDAPPPPDIYDGWPTPWLPEGLLSAVFAPTALRASHRCRLEERLQPVSASAWRSSPTRDRALRVMSTCAASAAARQPWR